MELTEIRQFFAEEIAAVSNIQTKGLVNAFATVPREHFLGPGPWQIMNPDGGMGGGGNYRPTPDADPRHVYHNVLLAIDPDRQLNNGAPSSLASWLDALELKEGDDVLHVGCGVGYYTAIIAEVVGATGHVTGVEIDPSLAARASENLGYLDHVDVVHTDGGEYDANPKDAIFVNAGATHVRSAWLDGLKPEGRLLLPLTFAANPEVAGMGFMLRVRRQEGEYPARFLSPVMIFPCIGSRDEDSNRRLRETIQRGTWTTVQSLRREPHEASDTCWLHDETFCLSTLPVGGES
jgi:protein-L-isoaspartate(D-aspartate) O-methyltransferase